MSSYASMTGPHSCLTGPLQQPSTMWKLQSSRAVMHLRCYPAEKRAQGQQGQSNLRAERDAEAVGSYYHDAARRQQELWESSTVTHTLHQSYRPPDS